MGSRRPQSAIRRLRTAAVAALLGFTMAPLVSMTPAHAAGCTGTEQTWTGANSTAWDDAGNWTSAEPGASDDVCIPDVSGASGNFPVITGGDAAVADELEIQADASLTITADSLTLSNVLDVAGTLTVGGAASALDVTGVATIGGGGTLIVNTAGGTASFGANLVVNANGSITWTDGDIDVTGFAVTNNGTISAVATGDTLTASTLTNNETFTKATPGTTTLAADVDSTSTSDLSITGGELAISGTLDVAGTASVSGGGSLDVTGSTTLATGGAFTLNSAAGSATFGANVTIDTGATLTWTDGNIDVGAFNIVNAGTIAATATSDTLTADTITNNNDFNKTGSGAATITADVVNSTTGTIGVSAGQLNINAANTLTQGGAITIGAGALNLGSGDYAQGTGASLTLSDADAVLTADPITINNGTVSSIGTLVGPVTVAGGTVNASNAVTGNLTLSGGTLAVAGTNTGSLGVSGTFAQSGGTLAVDIDATGTAGTDYDQLAVAGAANLTGTPALDVVTGTFDPADGDAFDLVTYASVTDEYDTVTEDLATGWEWVADHGATALTLTANALPGSIAGNVYEDEDGNGTLDVGDTTGVVGVTVFADTNDNGMLDGGEIDDTTISGGAFTLTGVGPGNVNVVAKLDGWATTVEPGTAGVVPVNPGQSVTGEDVGLFELGTVTGTVFDDMNQNGTMDSEDTGHEGIWVFDDRNDNGQKDDGEVKDQTDEDGVYVLAGIEEGTSKIRIVLPANTEQTTTDPTDIAVVSGTAESGVDFGIYTTVIVSQDPMTQGTGYWVVGIDGTIFAGGEAGDFGDLDSLGVTPNEPVVGLAPTPSGDGYWMVGTDGGVYAFGDALFHGSMGGAPLNEPVVGITPTPTGEGYWLVALDGGVFAFGDALFHQSMGGQPLNAPMVGIVSTPTGEGYWTVASDGGVFAFGDAFFHQSMGGQPLNAPIVGIATAPTVDGYWLVAEDGGVFAFGDALFYGSMGDEPLNAPMVGIRVLADGDGYWLFGGDGGVFSFGSALYHGNPMDE